MALIVPVLSVPRQTFTIDLNGQATRLRIYQRRYGLFMDVLLDEVLVIGGVLCHDRNLTVRSTYLGYVGDLTFLDTAGNSDPVDSGLGDRYVLLYLFPSEAIPLDNPVVIPPDVVALTVPLAAVGHTAIAQAVAAWPGSGL